MISERDSLVLVLLPADAVNIPPIAIEIICIAIPIRSSITVIVQAHVFPFSNP